MHYRKNDLRLKAAFATFKSKGLRFVNATLLRRLSPLFPANETKRCRRIISRAI